MEPEVNLNALVKRAKKLTGKPREVFPIIAANPTRHMEELLAETGSPSVVALTQHLSKIYRVLQLPRSMGLIYRRKLLKSIYDAMQNPSLLPPPSQRAAAPATNGREGHEAAAEPQSPALSPLIGANGHGQGLSTSIALANPGTILGVRTLSTAASDFEERCAEYVKAGYRPEVLNEYQSLTQPECTVASVIFVQRKN